MPRSHDLVGERALTIRIAPIESAPEGPGLARLPSQDVSDFLADLEASAGGAPTIYRAGSARDPPRGGKAPSRSVYIVNSTRWRLWRDALRLRQEANTDA